MPIYIIHNSDGDTIIREITEEEFLKDMNDNEYQNCKFAKEMPNTNTNEWDEKTYLLIEGKIIFPAPKEVTTKWEIKEKQ